MGMTGGVAQMSPGLGSLDGQLGIGQMCGERSGPSQGGPQPGRGHLSVHREGWLPLICCAWLPGSPLGGKPAAVTIK